MSPEQEKNSPDSGITEKLLRRDESALTEVSDRWGRLLYGLAMRITGSGSDAEECFNDALLDLWNHPPADPQAPLLPYVSTLVRRRSVDRVRFNTASRRGGGEYICALEELDQCLADPAGQPDSDSVAIRDALQAFLDGQDPDNRAIFLLRYYAAYSLTEIAQSRDLSERAVEMRLNRMRKRLRKVLAEYDVTV
jgi:RNA polymerase sigma-70 factor (ECF subfamily)